jgi:hypothetical protein
MTLALQVNQDGFVLYKGLAPALSTMEVAQGLGDVIDVSKMLPSSGIPAIQCLRPRSCTEVGRNQYSGNYGLATFPLHTDLAHWALPPRYLLLRCIVGSDDVFTKILPCSYVEDMVGADAMRRAVFTTRKRRTGYSGLVRTLSHHNRTNVYRWDPLFLKPLNQHAYTLTSAMLSVDLNSALTNVLLEHSGDAVLIDNWQMLHGRGPVSPKSIGRHIERVYLSEVFR